MVTPPSNTPRACISLLYPGPTPRVHWVCTQKIDADLCITWDHDGSGQLWHPALWINSDLAVGQMFTDMTMLCTEPHQQWCSHWELLYNSSSWYLPDTLHLFLSLYSKLSRSSIAVQLAWHKAKAYSSDFTYSPKHIHTNMNACVKLYTLTGYRGCTLQYPAARSDQNLPVCVYPDEL